MSGASKLRKRLSRVMRRQQERPVIHREQSRLTYGELANAIETVALPLRRHVPGSGGTVAILSDHVETTMVSALACILTGTPFVVLPPADVPHAQMVRLLTTCDAGTALGASDVHPLLRGLGFTPVCDVSKTDSDSTLFVRSSASVPIPEDVFALVGTSGTTGEPRAIACSAESLLKHVECLTTLYPIQHSDVIALTAPLSLLAGWNDVLLALLSGATLCPLDVQGIGAPTALRAFLDSGVTWWHTVPSLLRLVTQLPEASRHLASLRCIKAGGEALSIRDVENFRQVLHPDCLILHSYGASETGGSIAVLPLRNSTPLVGERLSVGRAVKGNRIQIVDDSGQIVGRDEVGEIVVAGKWFATGYHGQPELTQTRFRSVRWSKRRRFFTGDLGYVSSQDGMLYHLGRKDHVFKKGGMRINPTEIEMELQGHPALATSAVLVGDPESSVSNLLRAFYVVRAGQADPGPMALRQFLLTRIPHRMVPTSIQLIRQLPLLPTGKVDRHKLTNVEKSVPAIRVSSPRNELERIVSEVFSQVLQQDVGTYDDFWENGGDSLGALAVCATLEENSQLQIPPHLLGLYPTAAELAEIIAHLTHQTGSEIAAGQDELLIPLLGESSSAQVVVLPGGVGNEGAMALFVRLLSAIPEVKHALGFRAASWYYRTEPCERAEDVAAVYVEELNRQGLANQGLGIIGECLAGSVAFEIARARNCPWDRLILMDARAPNPHNPPRNDNDVSPFYRKYVQAVRRYGPHGYRGSTHLILSDEYAERNDPASGWAERASGTIQIHRVEGDHHTYLRDNYLQTAAVLRKCLVEDTCLSEAG